MADTDRYLEYQKLKKRFDFQLDRIKSTQLGFEDHGIFTFMVHTDSQGFGGYSGPEFLGVAIKRLLSTFGRDWEQLPGTPVYVLRDIEQGSVVFGERHNTSYIRGLASVPELGFNHRWIVMGDLFEEYQKTNA